MSKIVYQKSDFPLRIKLLPLEGAGVPPDTTIVITKPNKLPDGLPFNVIERNTEIQEKDWIE